MDKIRIFIAIAKDEKNKEYIAGVIESRMYPSTYALEHPKHKIIELGDINKREIKNTHIYI